MKPVTGKLTAWLSQYHSPEDLKGADDEVVNALAYRTSDMSEFGYSKVGTATITVELADESEVIENKVASLRAVQIKSRADAHAADVEFERKIQQLLAITNEVKP